jgi:hypothetical protein
VSASADLTGSGENESADDVFAAAPSRGSHNQSAPVAGYFGTDDALVRMWMRTRTQLDELGDGDASGDGDGDGDGDEGGAGTDTWVDTDTDADADASTGTDADDDSAYGLWPGPERSTRIE